MDRLIGWVLVVFAAVCGWSPCALAHPAVATSALAKVDRSGNLEIHVHHDVLAFVLNDTSMKVGDDPMNALLDHPHEQELARLLIAAKERAGTLTHVWADDQAVTLEVKSYPTEQEVLDWAVKRSPRLPVRMDMVLVAQLPSDAKNLRVRFPEILDPVVLTVESPGREAHVQLVRPGSDSELVDISIPPPAQAPVSAPEPDQRPAQGLSARSIIGFLIMGFEHILPLGVDHVLFVVAICLLDLKAKSVVTQVTLFTIAHSLTLALTAVGMVVLPDRLVETLIAASIALVGIENFFARRVHAWRLIIIFGFGLVHGLGFAAAFKEATGGVVTLGPVVWFNVGVELGQLSVVALVALSVGWWRNKAWFRPRVAIPISAIIALAGMYWTIERLAA